MRFVRKNIWIYGFVALLAMTAPVLAWAKTEAGGLRAAEHPDGVTRVVIDLSQSISFSTRLEDNPYRIIIDTETLNWNAHPSLPRTVGPILGVGYSEESGNGHLTLRLGKPSDIKSAFLMSPRDGSGWRFVLDLKDTTKQNFIAQIKAASPGHLTAQLPPPPPPAPIPESMPITQPAPSGAIIITSAAAQGQPSLETKAKPSTSPPVLTAALPPAPPVPPTPTPQPPTQNTETALIAPAQSEKPRADKDHKQSKDYRPVIVLDPGHGGVDPGATGVSGIYEKYITYSMARELQAQLEKTGRYQVHLTRDRDIFIPLRDRTAIARSNGADMFISLHADVVKDPEIRGLSVYTLSQNASDAEAQALADKENKSDLIAGIDLSHESSDVTNILIDLAQRETMNRSAGFAGQIVEELADETPLLTNTHRFAGFAVLKSPDVPAVLIEMGYLSNTIDEKNLRQPEYRAKLAHAITRAVDRYFLQGQKAKKP